MREGEREGVSKKRERGKEEEIGNSGREKEKE